MLSVLYIKVIDRCGRPRQVFDFLFPQIRQNEALVAEGVPPPSKNATAPESGNQRQWLMIGPSFVQTSQDPYCRWWLSCVGMVQEFLYIAAAVEAEAVFNTV